MKTNLNGHVAMLLMLALFGVSVMAQEVKYVKNDGTGDGSSWENAANLNSVFANLGTPASEVQLWITEGVYQITETLELPLKTSMYGGFSGTEISLSQRNLSNKTTIKGMTINGEKGKSILVAKAETEAAHATLIDGFIFTSCVADSGVAPLNQGVLELRQNRHLNNCIFTGNVFPKNAALYIEKANISNCLIYGNHNSTWNGCINLVTANMYNCTVVENTGGASKAVIRMNKDGKVYNSIFWGNDKQDYGVAGSEYISCTIQDKDSAYTYHTSSRPTLTNCLDLDAENTSLIGPRFEKTNNADYALGENSICIDAGNDEYTNDKTTDLLGHIRKQGKHVDLGCYEKSIESTNNTYNIADLESFYVYPNPVSSEISINNYEGSISVFDLNGKKVLNCVVAKDEKINVATLPVGVYQIFIQGSVRQFIKY